MADNNDDDTYGEVEAANEDYTGGKEFGEAKVYSAISQLSSTTSNTSEGLLSDASSERKMELFCTCV